MCEINPKHKRFFRLEFFTSHDMTAEQFESAVMNVCMNMEMKANEDMRLRCHIHELDEFSGASEKKDSTSSAE